MGISRRVFLTTLGAAVVTPPALAVGGYAYATEYEPSWIEVTHVDLTLPRLAPEFNGFRLAQFSDIHMDDFMTEFRLTEIVGMVNGLLPDMVAITGDFVTGRLRHVAENLKRALGLLSAPTVAVPGNHDHFGYIPVLDEITSEAGLIYLRNGVHTLQRGDAMLHFAGVDDVLEGSPQLDFVVSQLPPEGAAIMLVHEPDYADTVIQTHRFDLQISGHSHGGQVALPLLGYQYLPEMAGKYPRGLYEGGGMYLYTNRGVGMMKYRARFNARPEITVFTLYSPQR